MTFENIPKLIRKTPRKLIKELESPRLSTPLQRV